MCDPCRMLFFDTLRCCWMRMRAPVAICNAAQCITAAIVSLQYVISPLVDRRTGSAIVDTHYQPPGHTLGNLRNHTPYHTLKMLVSQGEILVARCVLTS